MAASWFIVGLGWLGEALAIELARRGGDVRGTHRSDCDLLTQELPALEGGVLFLNTPPLPTLSPQTYLARLVRVRPERVVFISSTSVYGARCGEVDEASAPAPDTVGGEWLCEVEAELRKKFAAKLLVVRPGGLIGGERHPVFHLQGRSGLSGGNERVNLIHRADLIRIILKAPAELTLVNAVAPAHPRKAEYYGAWAQKLSLPAPGFVDGPHSARLIGSRALPTFYTDWRCPELDWI